MQKNGLKILTLSAIALLAGGTFVEAAGPLGIDGGTPTNLLVSANTGWQRLGALLPSGYTNWTGGAFTSLDSQVDGLVASGIQVIMMFNAQAYKSGTPSSAWSVNSGGNGDNSTIQDFANNYVLTLIQHYQARGVKYFEIWNEPNGASTWVDPMCYAAMLSDIYVDVRNAGLGNPKTIIIGGSMYGWGNWWDSTSYNSANAGADWLGSVYSDGRNRGNWNSLKTTYGTYPLDAASQHVYLDTTSPDHFTQAHFENYINYVRTVLNNNGEGAKKTYITEWGFESSCNSSDPCSQANQDANIKTAVAAIYNHLDVVAAATLYRYEDVGDGESFGLTGVPPNYTPKTALSGYTDRCFFQGRYGLDNGNGPVENYYASHGQRQLGNPFNNGGGVWLHNLSGGGVSVNVQDCNDGLNGKLSLWDGPFGIYQVNDVHGFWDYYLSHGGISVIGAPKNEEYAWGSGTRQDFNNGYLSWDSANGVQWVPSWLFNTSFEGRDPKPTWNDTYDSIYNVSGYHSGINPECSIRTEQAHTGTNALMYSGTDNSSTGSYIYFRVFSVNIPVGSSTKMEYWIYPQQYNGQFVGVDYHCTDGTNLRDSGAVDYNGYRMHPNAGHGGNLTINGWNVIKCNVGQWLAGKTVDKIWVAYDQPPNTGQFRGYIDDILITNGTLP